MDCYSVIRLQIIFLLVSIIVHVFIISTLSTNSFISSTSKPRKSIFKLIHSDLIYPLKYLPDSTTNSYDNQLSLPEKPLAPVVASDFRVNFLVNITIGTPPIHNLVAMDTGSSLLWIQCQPCKRCRATRNPIYDPRKSSTFHNSRCYEKYCDQVDGDCDLENNCKYTIRYVDGSNSEGLLGFETLTFDTPDREKIELPGVLFGCGTNNYDVDRMADGLFGLGGSGTAILRSTLGKFSYCIGNINNPRYEYNQLALGDDAYFLGDSVPFQLFDGKYFVSLEGISFAGEEIPINPKEFEFNVLIDSGTTITFFKKEIVENLKSLVRKFIAGRLKELRGAGDYDLLCYRGSVEKDLEYFPVLILKLGSGTEILIGKEALFKTTRNPKYFCMGISGLRNRNVIGVVLQQYYNVGYDLNTMRVYFKRIECEFLDLQR